MEQAPIQNQENKEKDIKLVATIPRVQGGGTVGWWEGPEGVARLQQLRTAFLYGASDSEACYLAGINKQNLYYYCKRFPEFAIEKEELKLNTVFNARRIILRAMEKNPDLAWRYLAKKLPQEFGENPNPIINLGTMNTQVNQNFFDVPDNIDELLDGDEIKPAN